MPTTIETSERKEGSHPFAEATAAAKERDVRSLLKPGAAVVAEDLSGTGFTYRHDWGNKHGWWKLTLNWGAVHHNSRVFVSTSEFGGGAQVPFVGDATYTVHNVAPFDGGVVVRIYIGWGSDIRVQVSYLVINP